MPVDLPVFNSLQGMGAAPRVRYQIVMGEGSAASAFSVSVRDWRQRRRMSQLELALVAGTTQRHLSFIESGRSSPGRGMVLRLAEALDIPLRERNALLLSADYAPCYSEAGFDDPELGAIRGALERVLDGHRPYPAVITDRCGELAGSNGAFWSLAAGASEALLAAPVNVPRLMLHPDGLAARIENLETWGWHVIEALRQETARNPDERSEKLLAELEGLVPEGPATGSADFLGLAVPLVLGSDLGELRLITTLSHFGTALHVALAELRLEAFLPADEETAVALAELDRRASASRNAAS